jgi:hypothetical protein
LGFPQVLHIPSTLRTPRVIGFPPVLHILGFSLVPDVPSTLRASSVLGFSLVLDIHSTLCASTVLGFSLVPDILRFQRALNIARALRLRIQTILKGKGKKEKKNDERCHWCSDSDPDRFSLCLKTVGGRFSIFSFLSYQSFVDRVRVYMLLVNENRTEKKYTEHRPPGVPLTITLER